MTFEKIRDWDAMSERVGNGQVEREKIEGANFFAVIKNKNKQKNLG